MDGSAADVGGPVADMGGLATDMGGLATDTCTGAHTGFDLSGSLPRKAGLLLLAGFTMAVRSTWGGNQRKEDLHLPFCLSNTMNEHK